MVSGLDLARAPRRARLTARKKGSGYENGLEIWNRFQVRAPASVPGPHGFEMTSHTNKLPFLNHFKN